MNKARKSEHLKPALRREHMNKRTNNPKKNWSKISYDYLVKIEVIGNERMEGKLQTDITGFLVETKASNESLGHLVIPTKELQIEPVWNDELSPKPPKARLNQI